jgi:chromosome segregation ATPase
MRITTILGTSLLSMSLLAGTACRKHDTDKAGSEMKKAREDVDDKAKDLTKTQDKQNNEVAKDQAKLDEAKADLSKARADFSSAVKTRLDKIDTKINELATRTDVKSKETLTSLKQRRADLQAKIDAMGTQTADHWDDFKKDVDNSFDSLEKDLDNATK